MKEERVYIGDIHGGIFGWLVNATIASLIDWKPTEEPLVETKYGTTEKGYEGKIGDLSVRTIVRPKNERGDLVYSANL